MSRAKSNGKHPNGRPPIVSTPEALEAKVRSYFQQGKDDPLFCPTITGLVLFCGYADRKSFYDLEERSGFSHTIKKARSQIEEVYERRLHGSTPAGAIFALKNFGWTDRIQVNGAATGDTYHITTVNIEAKKEELAGDILSHISRRTTVPSNGA